MRRILWTIIAISLLSGCSTPYEYVYVYPDPVRLPTIEEAISPDIQERLDEPLDLVMEPETVGDILKNMAEYQQAYILYHEYSDALEEYINRIISIHNGDIKDGENGSL